MESLTELFCLIDNFCRLFELVWERHLLALGTKRRHRPSLLRLSELMTTLVILFHQLRFRQFESFYLGYVCRHLRTEFPTPPSYPRHGTLTSLCCPLAASFHRLKGECDGISMADATALAVKVTVSLG